MCMHAIPCHRLCRAIALAANVVELTYGSTGSPCTILQAVSRALEYISDEAPSTGSLDGFLELTDSIIYAIKIAGSRKSTDSEDSTCTANKNSNLKAVSIILYVML